LRTIAHEPLAALSSVEQASTFMGVGVATLDTWRCRGCGPPWYKLGGKIIRHRLDDLEAWMDSSRRDPHEPTGLH